MKNIVKKMIVKSRLLPTAIFLCLAFMANGQKNAAATRAIHAAMREQQEAWNAGDIDAFMRHYWQSDSLQFIGSRGITYGWRQTRDNYKVRYPDRTAMGMLTFTILKTDILSKKSAFMIGRWALKRSIGDVGGHFTLLWKKIEGRWVIVVDHTS